MILKLIPRSRTYLAVHELDQPDLIVDPRPIGSDCEYLRFKVTITGTTLTVTRIDKREGWHSYLRFRVYHSHEQFFSFECTKYLYYGLVDETAPDGTTEVVVRDGLEEIEDGAFKHCDSLTKISLPDSVKYIGYRAFFMCTSLQYVRLPPHLHTIANQAFYKCSSLQAIFIPNTVDSVGDFAFSGCKSMKMINIPEHCKNYYHHATEQIDTIEYPDDPYRWCVDNWNFDEVTKVTEWLKNRLNPFHKHCSGTMITAKSIQRAISENQSYSLATINDKNKMIALHLLVANPYVKSGDVIDTYLNLAPDAATVQDSSGRTALHILCSLPESQLASGEMMQAYLHHATGKEAAFMRDARGMMPFDYLCRQPSFDGIPFLQNKTFSELSIWWYECMGISLFAK